MPSGALGGERRRDEGLDPSHGPPPDRDHELGTRRVDLAQHGGGVRLELPDADGVGPAGAAHPSRMLRWARWRRYRHVAGAMLLAGRLTPFPGGRPHLCGCRRCRSLGDRLSAIAGSSVERTDELLARRT